MRSDSNSRQIVSALSEIVGHSAAVGELLDGVGKPHTSELVSESKVGPRKKEIGRSGMLFASICIHLFPGWSHLLGL